MAHGEFIHTVSSECCVSESTQTSSILPKVSSWELFLHSAVLCTNTQGCLPTLLAVGFGCVVTAKQVECTLTPSHERWEHILITLHHSGRHTISFEWDLHTSAQMSRFGSN